MSKSKKLPAGLPPVAEPIEKPATPEVAEPIKPPDYYKVLVEDIEKMQSGVMTPQEADAKYGAGTYEQMKFYQEELAKAIPPAMTVEEEAYQLEQETVTITAEPPTCPRCGSTERTRLLEISPRLETDSAVIIRYRTQCRGRIFPVDKEGKPVTDKEGKPVSYECGNRYKVKKIVPKVRKSAS